ncbi:hypothetical protein D3C87_1272480 [compost metagenome]
MRAVVQEPELGLDAVDGDSTEVGEAGNPGRARIRVAPLGFDARRETVNAVIFVRFIAAGLHRVDGDDGAAPMGHGGEDEAIAVLPADARHELARVIGIQAIDHVAGGVLSGGKALLAEPGRDAVDRHLAQVRLAGRARSGFALVEPGGPLLGRPFLDVVNRDAAGAARDLGGEDEAVSMFGVHGGDDLVFCVVVDGLGDEVGGLLLGCARVLADHGADAVDRHGPEVGGLPLVVELNLAAFMRRGRQGVRIQGNGVGDQTRLRRGRARRAFGPRCQEDGMRGEHDCRRKHGPRRAGGR